MKKRVGSARAWIVGLSVAAVALVWLAFARTINQKVDRGVSVWLGATLRLSERSLVPLGSTVSMGGREVARLHGVRRGSSIHEEDPTRSIVIYDGDWIAEEEDVRGLAARLTVNAASPGAVYMELLDTAAFRAMSPVGEVWIGESRIPLYDAPAER